MSRWAQLGGAWPTGEQELLIRAALLEPARAAESWERWRVDAGDLDGLDANTGRLFPLVYRRLAAAGVDDEDLGRLKGIYRHWWYRNQMLLARARTVVDLLEEGGMPTMLLKGCALGPLYYRDMGTRPMTDVDVVVPRERAVEALALLERTGWRAQRAAPADPRIVTRVQHAEAHTGPESEALDLHWQVLRQPVAQEDFWEHSVPLEVNDLSTRTLCAADHVVHGCVHGADGGMEGVRWVPDVVIVARSGDVSWERVVEVSRRQRVSHTIAEALSYVTEVFEAPVPADALAALRASGAPRRERAAHRAATLPPTRLRVLRTVWDRYRRLARFEGRRPNPLRFPAYMQAAMGFRDRRHMLRVTWRRLTGRSAVRRPRDPAGRARDRPPAGG